MSTTIDQRVVEMRFDNQHFEKNVSSTMSTLDKLKQKLNLTGASKGFEDIDSAAKKVSFAPMMSGIEQVGVKFSYLQATIQHQLNNIVDSAVNASKRIVSAFTIDPIKTGFSEYETQINAVQTILANTESKGTTLNDVNSALDTLNTYADKTIYNFTEMTRNIGTFTAAGIDLDTSVTAIQGIANLAAVSGSNSQQASTAMYQLSQALASGTVKLMDWNSVVNAGMGGQVFQDALKETARVHGVAIDNMIESEGSFRETLKNGWLTSEILTETLSKFTMTTEGLTEAQIEQNREMLKSQGYTDEQIESIFKLGNTATNAATKVKTFTQLMDTLKEAAQSGWTQTWETVVGDFEEAKELWTNVSDTVGKMIGDSADSRNSLISGALDNNWEKLIGKMSEAGIESGAFEEKAREALEAHGHNVDELIAKHGSLSKAFRSGEVPAEVLKEAINGLSSTLKNAGISTDDCLELADAIGEMGGREKLIESLKNIFEGLMNVAKPIKEAFREIFPPMTVKQLTNFIDKFRSLSERFKEFTSTHGEQIYSTFKGIFSVIDIGVTFVKELAGGIMDLLGNFAGLAGGLLGGTASLGDWLSNVRDSIKEGNLFGNVIDKITGFLSNIITKIKEFGKSVKEGFKTPGDDGIIGFLKTIWKLVTTIGSGIGRALSSVGQTIANVFGENSFGDVLSSGLFAGLLAALFKFIKNLNSPFESLSGMLDNVVGILDDVRGCFQAYQQQLKAGTLVKIATAIGLLAAAIFVISTIDPEALGKSLGAITVLFGELLGSLAIFTKIGGNLKGTFKAVPLMISMAASLLILSAAMKVLSTIKLGEMGVALLGLTVGMGVLIGAVNLLPEKKLKQAAKAIRILASSLLIFSLALKIMGSMSWGEIGRGLVATVVGLGALVVAIKLLPKDIGLRTVGLISLATSLVILGGALKIMGSMSWGEIGKGLATLAGSLLAITVAMRLMPKNTVKIGIGLLGVATALVILSSALKSMGSMSWDEIGRGLVVLGGALLELAIALNLMRGTTSGSLALILASTALLMITPVLATLGKMSWKSIAKGLVTLAGAFAVVGVAGLLLKPLIPTILSLSISFALFGVATAALGAGLLLIAAGIGALATALAGGATAIVASITVIIAGFLDLIPTIISKIAEGVVAFAKVIGDCAPQLAESLLKLIHELLAGLATYVPMIADALFSLLINILNVVAERMPELITAAINVIGAFFQGVVDALGSIDTTSMLQGIAAVGLLSGLIYALSAIGPLIPGAMVGVLGIGVILAELSLVLAAVGALAQIPGLSWLVEEGGDFLEKVGTAIGKFIGGFIGGIAQGFTSSLPQLGTDLSEFMTNLQPFIDGAATIDTSVIDGVKSLVGVILAITGASIVESLASWLTGGSSLIRFGAELAEFAPYIKQYSDTIAGIDSSAVTASATAASALSALASNLPNSGGLAGLLAGENDLGAFAEQLIPFGTSLKGYAAAVSGIDSQAIIDSAAAAKALADMTSCIPNEGGVVSWFAGENSISKFGADLIELAIGLKGYSAEISGLNTEAVLASVTAAKALVDMTSAIPNSGGVASWFAGENSIAKFGIDLISLGVGLKGFSMAITGIVPENMIAAASAAKALAEMTAAIPNEGGVVSWFAGENSIAKFAGDLPTLGNGLKGFSDSLTGIVPENVVGAANAAKALAEMTAMIPNEGGVVSWFTGENSIAKFAGDLPTLGNGLKGFSDSLTGIVPENIIAAANAAKSLADLTSAIPTEGGIKAWFTGESSVSKFGTDLVSLGEGLKGFDAAVVGIVPENITAAANAAKSLADLTSAIPTEGGVKAWFTGETSLSKFSTDLVSLGEGLSGFSTAITGIVPENITSAANAARALAEMTNVIPKEGGIKAWFSGETSISKFAGQLPLLGSGLKGFSDSISGIVPENITAAADSAMSLARMTESTPDNTDKLTAFGENLKPFGESLKAFSISVSEIVDGTVTRTTNVINAINKATEVNSEGLSSSADGINKLITSLKRLPSISEDTVSGFCKAMDKLGKTSIDDLVKSFNSSADKLSSSGRKMITSLTEGINSNRSALTTAANDISSAINDSFESKTDTFKNIGTRLITAFSKGISSGRSKVLNAASTSLNGAVTKLNSYYDSFYSAGSNLVSGFADGISANTFRAEAKAAAMASAAYEAAKEALDINSPSKIFRKLGYSVPEGLAMGIDRLSWMVGDSAVSMADVAISEVRNSISRIGDAVNNDIDTQPTIRPVLDLSDVRTGAKSLNGMLSFGTSARVMTNVGSISSAMRQSNQNGANDEVVSAIDKLRGELGNVGGTQYIIDGITYDDGSNISEAVKSLVRAAKVQRRI